MRLSATGLLNTASGARARRIGRQSFLKAVCLWSECFAWSCWVSHVQAVVPPCPSVSARLASFLFPSQREGLRQATLHKYTYTLRPFESYLAQTGITLSALTPASITDFINTRAKTLHKSGMLGTTGALRAFLAYLHREGIIANDSYSQSSARPGLSTGIHSTRHFMA